jgi:ABC-2 type transport system ATP-binding protein
LIDVESLTKKFGDLTAVEDLSLRIDEGEIFGFLGPNGAGKTTTIRILTTLAKPTSGSIRISGFDLLEAQDKIKNVIGVVQQHLTLDLDLNVRENMELHCRLHHVPSKERKQRIADLLQYVGLTKQSEKMVENLSGGMKKAAMIARALVHKPKVLFLDEPTVGLDVQARRRMWDLIRSLNNDGTTIFLTTHYIEEAEALCKRVGIIHQGRLIALGKPTDLRQKVGMITLEIVADGRSTRYEHFPDREAATNYVQSLPSDVKNIVIRESSLEDVFVKLTGQKVDEN